MTDSEHLRPFHLAIAVRDLKSTRQFYGGILNCHVNSHTRERIDFDFFGHQITAYVSPPPGISEAREEDQSPIPVPHWGITLNWQDWQGLAARLKAHQVPFIIPPSVRFAGKPSEQATMLFTDPSGNALEIKAFRNEGAGS